ncbi:PQQ-dependent sugar dehydrogenase [Aestuariivirga litoralis]|uniref:PQQ-dependent sugar dehydrogenase n=1 Tax=Aestuariivirga litoralis TaxID=2650924 RepID=UPI001FEEF0C6|nr:sorbosone dehydrogenase family protein [Aestuariivirga litoralis]
MLRLCTIILLALASPALADTLTGPAAFGDWKADAPGVTRHIRAEDVPAPAADTSASNPAKLVPMPEGATLKLPEGFTASLVASGFSPRVIRFAPNGDLFVADSKDNQIRMYHFGDGLDKAPTASIYAKGLNRPYGIAFYPPGPEPAFVYVANADGVVRFSYKSGDVAATAAPKQIISGIPASGHWTRDIAFSPDGKLLYVSVGSSGNVASDMPATPEDGLESWIKNQPLGAAWGAEAGRANVLAFSPDGQNRQIWATGLRNCAGITIQPANADLWCVVNERDGLGDNLPFEYATHVPQGAYFGWPWYYTGDHQDTRPDSERPDLKGKVSIGDVLIQAHSAPLNIAFYEGSAFPAEYKGDAFVTLHGSWNRATRTGYKIVRLLFRDGKPTGEYQDFITGFVKSDKEVWGRPVGIAVAPDGSLFFSEDGSGNIWRVTYQGG